MADVVLLKYNLSPKTIKEKMENKFNFVIPLSKISLTENKPTTTVENIKNNNETKASMDSITPLKFHLSTICTIGFKIIVNVFFKLFQQYINLN